VIACPFFADGSIVGDYKPLAKYWEILKRESRPLDSALLNHTDFRFLEEVVNTSPGLDVASLINMLQHRFLERIDCRLAAQAFREAYGVELDEEEACKRLARIMAGWLIEAGKISGILKIRFAWRNGGALDKR